VTVGTIFVIGFPYVVTVDDGAISTLSGKVMVMPDEALLFPTELIAITVNVYATALLSPVNVHEVLAVFTHPAGGVTLGEDVTVYPVITEPPLYEGAVQEITDC
jgi:hypothetical protein